jgi:hypothetical protein
MQPSASKTTLLLNCQYPFDPNLELPPDEGGAAARYGSAFHEVIAKLGFDLTKRPANYAELIDEACARWRLKDKQELAGHVWGSFVVLRKWMGGKNPWGADFTKGRLEKEKAYAINPANYSVRSVELDLDTHTYEGLSSEELGATGDIVGLDANPAPIIEDHKTGSYENFSSPALNDQLKTLALISYLKAAGPVVVAVLHADRRGLPMMYADEIDISSLERHRFHLTEALKRVGDGGLRPGPWCKYCRARPVCPTQYASIVPSAIAIVEASGGLVGAPETAVTTAEQVGRFHQLRAEMRRLLEQGDAEVKAFVKDNPELVVTRPDGKHLEFVPREVERLSKKSVVDALGKVAGEKMLSKLRELGCVPKVVEEQLWALDDR